MVYAGEVVYVMVVQERWHRTIGKGRARACGAMTMSIEGGGGVSCLLASGVVGGDGWCMVGGVWWGWCVVGGCKKIDFSTDILFMSCHRIALDPPLGSQGLT